MGTRLISWFLSGGSSGLKCIFMFIPGGVAITTYLAWSQNGLSVVKIKSLILALVPLDGSREHEHYFHRSPCDFFVSVFFECRCLKRGTKMNIILDIKHHCNKMIAVHFGVLLSSGGIFFWNFSLVRAGSLCNISLLLL